MSLGNAEMALPTVPSVVLLLSDDDCEVGGSSWFRTFDGGKSRLNMPSLKSPLATESQKRRN